MSGSSRVEFRSEYYHLRSESPCMNFATDPDRPDRPDPEQRWHGMLAAQPDPELPLVTDEERYPLWRPDGKPESPPPWRVPFVGMSGPGMTEIQVAFSRLPSEAAREGLRAELIKDVALVDQIEGAW